MTRAIRAAAAGLLLVAVFAAGYWTAHRDSTTSAGAGERKVLYWVDPMHPSYKSDKPGIAPDCGMQLVPVYADGGGAASSQGAPTVPGAVQVPADKQQLFGVQVRAIERAAVTRPIRTVGRVIPDEDRTYRMLAAADGWIRSVHTGATTGETVVADQPLATFYAPEFLAAEQAYIFAMSSFDRFQATGKETADQIKLTKANIQQYADGLRNLGMSPKQIEELGKTRQLTQDIVIAAPAPGFILTRNITPGQLIERGTELFRIADMSRVWILADVFGQEAEAVHPGAHARITIPGHEQTLEARVANVLPQFDPATRTMKVRLEAANPKYVLRADMFVDVELALDLAPALTVPVDAVLDSGLRKVVYVDRGNGNFEPRQVETGWRSGDQVQILSGLDTGDRIVVSGNFLIDSESRMKQAAAGLSAAAEKDPVCGMDVEPAKAKAAGRWAEHGGKTYYFCSEQCLREFREQPGKFAK